VNNPEHVDPQVLKKSLVRAASEHRTANRYDDQHIIDSIVPDRYRTILSDDDIAEMLADYSVRVWSYTEFHGDRHE
jgi:hypothetical protein